MRYKFLLLLPILGSYSCRTQYSFDRELGVISGSTGKPCLLVRNATVQPGQPVEILSADTPQSLRHTEIAAPDPDCAPEGNSAGLYAYRLTTPISRSEGPFIGILNYSGPFSKGGDLLTADLDGDGVPEYFRACPSTEGIHFTAWKGRPLVGRRLWHQYYYLGYDLEPGCKAEETAEEK